MINNNINIRLAISSITVLLIVLIKEDYFAHITSYYTNRLFDCISSALADLDKNFGYNNTSTRLEVVILALQVQFITLGLLLMNVFTKKGFLLI